MEADAVKPKIRTGGSSNEYMAKVYGNIERPWSVVMYERWPMS